MAKIMVLTKTGRIIETQVDQTVDEIWDQFNPNPQIEFNPNYIILSSKGKPIIFNKRYVFKIEE
jgi:hypothetical protein